MFHKIMNVSSSTWHAVVLGIIFHVHVNELIQVHMGQTKTNKNNHSHGLPQTFRGKCQFKMPDMADDFYFHTDGQKKGYKI